MTVIERRVFFGKPGAADAVVGICEEFIEMMKPMGGMRSARVLTDRLSGRTDRVVMETEGDSIGAFESEMSSAMADAETVRKFEATFSRLTELITHAEVDYWTVR